MHHYRLLSCLLCAAVLHPLSAAETMPEAPEAPLAKAAAADNGSSDSEKTASVPALEDSDDDMSGLAGLKKELEALQVENQLHEARLQRQLAAQQAERQRLEAEQALAQQRHQSTLAEGRREQEQLALQTQVKQARQELALQEQRLANERRQLELQHRQAELQEKQLESQIASIEMESTSRKLQLAQMEQQIEEWEASRTHRDLDRRRQLWEKRQQLATIVEASPQHLDAPFADGVLTISNRRVSLNSPIIKGTADYICDRIHYFNNRDQRKPIFLVIDYCPGGSVMEGYRIVKAIRSSDAPVHVVVKSFAASMAAVILSEADHSYAFPNAIILHHQPSGIMWGNVAEQQEQVDLIKEWARRLHGRTAERMDIDIDTFYQRMYDETVTGDWEEFADVAQELNWVDHLVHDLRETGVVEHPTSEDPWEAYRRRWAHSGETAEAPALGGPILLPRPRAFDFYFLHNRDGRFAIAGQ